MSGVIHPFVHGDPAYSAATGYQIAPWSYYLPAFDPLPMVKTVLLSSKSVKRYNRTVSIILPLLKPFVYTALALRFATFAAPAHTGRLLAPISVSLHMFGMVTTSAQLRTEYTKLLLRTFDFWFLQTANTICTVVLSSVLGDLRVVLVLFCWADFTCWLVQETYLRNSHAIVVVALAEWLFYVLLMAAISFEFVDEAHHYSVITSCGRTLSTKDVLVNAIGTMTMISLRHLYRRYQGLKPTKTKSSTAMRAVAYRSKISLVPAGPWGASVRNSIVPQDASRNVTLARLCEPTSTTSRSTDQYVRPLLQLYLSAEADRFNPNQTLWPRIGSLVPLSSWKVAVLHLNCVTGSSFAVLSIFLPEHAPGACVVGVVGLVATSVFTGIYACCCQRQLLKRVVTSFHFLFLWAQVLAITLLEMEMFRWRWVPVCGSISCLLLAQTILTIDALTPIMKRRLHFAFWMPVLGIALFLMVQVLILVDAFALGYLALEDKVIMDIKLLGRHSRFLVVPTLVSRVFTVIVWSGRYVYVLLTRQDDNALVLLRGEVEFDYESWKKQAHLNHNRGG